MKKFLTIAVFTGAIFALIMRFLYDQAYNAWNVSSALFLIGLPLFLISVLMVTSATDVFIAFGFAFRKMFSRGNGYVGMSLYDYKQAQKEKVDTTGIAIAGIVVSLIVNGISLYIAYALVPY